MRKIILIILIPVVLLMCMFVPSIKAEEPPQVVLDAVLNLIKSQLHDIYDKFGRSFEPPQDWLVFRVKPGESEIISTWIYHSRRLTPLEKALPLEEIFYLSTSKYLTDETKILGVKRFYSHYFCIYQEGENTFIEIVTASVPSSKDVNLYKVGYDARGKMKILLVKKLLST